MEKSLCGEDDDFEAEVESLRNNPEFMEFLVQLSQEEAVIFLKALLRKISETALLSEAALAEEWLRPEEAEAWSYLQPQQQFVELSFEERQSLLKQQAAEMVDHYQQTMDERTEWQSGDFTEQYV